MKREKTRAHAFLKYAGYEVVMALLKRKALELQQAVDDEELVRQRVTTLDDPDPDSEDYSRAQERSSLMRREFAELHEAAREAGVPVLVTISECAVWNGEPPVPKVEKPPPTSTGAVVDITA